MDITKMDCGTGSEGNKWLYENLLTDTPLCVGKIGGTECPIVANVIYSIEQKTKIQITDSSRKEIQYLCGVHPPNDYTLIRYTSSIAYTLKYSIDALAPWNSGKLRGEERILSAFCRPKCRFFQLKFLDPLHFTDETPWTHALSGKRVLVISPFKKTILSQYEKIDKWNRNGILPNDIKSLNVFQSKFSKPLDPNNGHDDYIREFNRLRRYIEDSAHDYDVVLAGCGAAGLPLCGYAKQCELQAIHTAGSTQLLFGILGGRWESRDYVMNQHYNEDWVYPLEEETPENIQEIISIHHGEPTYFKFNRK